MRFAAALAVSVLLAIVAGISAALHDSLVGLSRPLGWFDEWCIGTFAKLREWGLGVRPPETGGER